MVKKLTVLLTDKNDKRMRDYIALHYPLETYGKLSEFVNDAIGYFLNYHR